VISIFFGLIDWLTGRKGRLPLPSQVCTYMCTTHTHTQCTDTCTIKGVDKFARVGAGMQVWSKRKRYVQSMKYTTVKHVKMYTVHKVELKGMHTRNTHAHLCLAPVCRLCARACHMRVQVRRAWHVLRLQLFGVCSIQAGPVVPKNAVVRDLSESSVSECVRLCNAHMAYT